MGVALEIESTIPVTPTFQSFPTSILDSTYQDLTFILSSSSLQSWYLNLKFFGSKFSINKIEKVKIRYMVLIRIHALWSYYITNNIQLWINFITYFTKDLTFNGFPFFKTFRNSRFCSGVFRFKKFDLFFKIRLAGNIFMVIMAVKIAFIFFLIFLVSSMSVLN